MLQNDTNSALALDANDRQGLGGYQSAVEAREERGSKRRNFSARSWVDVSEKKSKIKGE